MEITTTIISGMEHDGLEANNSDHAFNSLSYWWRWILLLLLLLMLLLLLPRQHLSIAFICEFFFVPIVNSGGFIFQCSNKISDNFFFVFFFRISSLVSIHFVLHEYTHPSAWLGQNDTRSVWQREKSKSFERNCGFLKFIMIFDQTLDNQAIRMLSP